MDMRVPPPQLPVAAENQEAAYFSEFEGIYGQQPGPSGLPHVLDGQFFWWAEIYTWLYEDTTRDLGFEAFRTRNLAYGILLAVIKFSQILNSLFNFSGGRELEFVDSRY
jgi:hypothetical protein